MCCAFLYFLPDIFVILRGDERDMIKIFIGLHVKCRYSCQILIKLEFSRDIFVKILNMKYVENPSSGSSVVPCGRPDGSWTDATKLIFAFRNFVNQPDKQSAQILCGTFAVCSEAHTKHADAK